MDRPLTPETLLLGYANGIFPMAERATDEALFWVDPKRRGVIPLDGFRLSRSLAKTLRRGHFRITFDTAFEEVVEACADRDETWINAPLALLYSQLHRAGYAHALEVWEDKALVGGVFGIALGGAFFGESMFSRRTDASKVALAYLVDRLRQTGFTLFDTQFLTPHLASLGGVEIPRMAYRKKLAEALTMQADITAAPVPTAQDVIQRNAQTS